MNREDILNAARAEKSAGEYEIGIERKGFVYAFASVIILCMVMVFLEIALKKPIDWGKVMFIPLIRSVADLYEGIRLSRKKRTVSGVVFATLSFVLLLAYIGGLLR